jgi:hypothetical protein
LKKAPTGGNYHLAEERNLLQAYDEDEEKLYSAVTSIHI